MKLWSYLTHNYELFSPKFFKIFFQKTKGSEVKILENVIIWQKTTFTKSRYTATNYWIMHIKLHRPLLWRFRSVFSESLISVIPTTMLTHDFLTVSVRFALSCIFCDIWRKVVSFTQYNVCHFIKKVNWNILLVTPLM